MKESLEKISLQLLQEEGINSSFLDMVDLDIGFSPVIPIKGGSVMEAIKIEEGFYRVPDFPMAGLNIPEKDFKIMRCRYLINR